MPRMVKMMTIHEDLVMLDGETSNHFNIYEELHKDIHSHKDVRNLT